MLQIKDILDESNPQLRVISQKVTFPLLASDKKAIEKMITYLTNSQIEEYAQKYKLRPGMGLAAIQLGIEKRFFVIVHEQELKQFKNYIIFNPKIISHSAELIYAGNGEGCLSVNRDVPGIVPRYARLTIEYQDENGQKQTLRAREELAIALQHELDHLDGILFIDKINPTNPYHNENKMRMV